VWWGGRVGEKIHNNKITTDNWRRFADKNKETGNKGQKKQTKRRGNSPNNKTQNIKKNHYNSLPFLRKQQPGGLGQRSKNFNVDVIRRVF
jgi:hypothetical protein